MFEVQITTGTGAGCTTRRKVEKWVDKSGTDLLAYKSATQQKFNQGTEAGYQKIVSLILMRPVKQYLLFGQAFKLIQKVVT